MPLLQEHRKTSSHLPNCAQLRTIPSKTTEKRKYLDLEEEEEFKKSEADIRKISARRQRKDAKRSRDAKASAEAMKMVDPAVAQCYCSDVLSNSEEETVREEARIIRHTHTDRSTTFHLMNCPMVRSRSKYAPHHQPYTSPPNLAPYIHVEEKEMMTNIGKKQLRTVIYPTL